MYLLVVYGGGTRKQTTELTTEACKDLGRQNNGRS